VAIGATLGIGCGAHVIPTAQVCEKQWSCAARVPIISRAAESERPGPDNQHCIAQLVSRVLRGGRFISRPASIHREEIVRTILFASLILTAAGLHAETGYDAWLRYAQLNPPALAQYRNAMPAVVAAYGDSEVLDSARQELIRGVRGMLGRTLRVESSPPHEGAVVLGTLGALRPVLPKTSLPGSLPEDAYLLKTAAINGIRCIVVTAGNDHGVLYGTFALLRKIALGEPIRDLDETQTPYAPVRWVNQWDNLNGTIERGYGGRSIFFDDNNVRADLSRASDYARLLASLGINGCAINNVNADPRILTPEFLPQLARIAAAFRPWGVRLVLSVDFGSPKTVGGLDTFDPLNTHVADWWKKKADEIYRAIPDLGGFVMKADSEGRAGPRLTAERTPTPPMWWRAP